MATTKDTTRSVNRNVGFVFGGLYLLIGIAGFGVTDGMPFTARDGAPLLGFDVNPLHNVVHLVIGAALALGAIAGLRASKRVNATIGVAYLGTAIAGLFLAEDAREANILAIDHADNGLHLFSALLLLGVAFLADRNRRRVITIGDAATHSPRPVQRQDV